MIDDWNAKRIMRYLLMDGALFIFKELFVCNNLLYTIDEYK